MSSHFAARPERNRRSGFATGWTRLKRHFRAGAAQSSTCPRTPTAYGARPSASVRWSRRTDGTWGIAASSIDGGGRDGQVGQVGAVVRPARAAAAMAPRLARRGSAWRAADAATAGAARPSGCCFNLVPGPILGALGSYGINFRAIPDGPAETCTATFSATASITGPGGVKPVNVNSNPLTSTFTVTFSPNRLGPLVGWLWSPHCADPANEPDTFTATSAAGGVAGVPLPSLSCSEQGGPGLRSNITHP